MEERWTEGGTWTGDSWTGLLDVRALHSAAGRKKELCRSEQANHETKLLNEEAAGRQRAGQGCWTGENWTGERAGQGCCWIGESWLTTLWSCWLDGREMNRVAGQERAS